jgi:hypothetical protein
MKRAALVLATLVTASIVHAQPQPTDTFLEQRVVEALAADGVVLSRLGVTLDVEQIGGKVLVSLVDQTTGRVAASTKVDALPPDPEAAVASLTQVASNLVSQVVGTKPASAEPPPPRDDAAERRERERELAELRYAREAIRFDDDVAVTGHDGSVSTRREWFAYRGESRHRLSEEELYEALGRPDLARTYRRRVRTVATLAVVGLAAILGGSLYAGFGDTERDENLGIGVAIGGGVALTGALIYGHHASPLGEGEAKRLADEHNQKLRRDLGLPHLGTSSRPRIRDVQWAPVIGRDAAGLALTGRF